MIAWNLTSTRGGFDPAAPLTFYRGSRRQFLSHLDTAGAARRMIRWAKANDIPPPDLAVAYWYSEPGHAHIRPMAEVQTYRRVLGEDANDYQTMAKIIDIEINDFVIVGSSAIIPATLINRHELPPATIFRRRQQHLRTSVQG